MKIAKSPLELLEVLKQHELAIAELYEVYAEVLPEFRDFWIDLSTEERQHAEWIDELYAEIRNNDEDFVVERFSIPTIKHSTEFINQQAINAHDSDFILINALSTALQIERGLIEKRYFEVFEGDSANTQKILKLLDDCTRSHYEKLYNFWQENRI